MKMKTTDHPMVGRFIVIETQYNTPQPTVSGTVHGPFPTQADAEQWIVADAIATFGDSDRSLQGGPAEDWGSDMFVAEIRRVCRPVPVVTIEARIMDVPSPSAVPESDTACRQCGGQPKHWRHAGGHDVECEGCGAHGVVDHESESDAWMAWIRFNVAPIAGGEA